MKIPMFLRRIFLPNTYSGEAYINYLRSIGVEIGDKCRIWNPNHTNIDTQRPHMLHIGDRVRITGGVTILCHDYSRSVFSEMKGLGNVGEARETWIGNNVFIGVKATILMGTHIGNNSVVGAGAVVSGSFPDNSVIAGNPARVIMTIEEFYEKRKKQEVSAAKLYARNYYKRHKRWPDLHQMTDAFVWLYLPHTEETIRQYPEFFPFGTLDVKTYTENFLASEPVWASFEDFISECQRETDG